MSPVVITKHLICHMQGSQTLCKMLVTRKDVVQSLSRVQLVTTPWTAACQAPLSFVVCQSLLRFVATESVMPSHPLSSSSPFAFNRSSIRVFSNESALCIQWPKYWSFIISPSKDYSGLISNICWIEEKAKMNSAQKKCSRSLWSDGGENSCVMMRNMSSSQVSKSWESCHLKGRPWVLRTSISPSVKEVPETTDLLQLPSITTGYLPCWVSSDSLETSNPFAMPLNSLPWNARAG